MRRTFSSTDLDRRNRETFGNWRDGIDIESLIVESWGQGFMLGSLMLISLITVVNMRRGVVLHKLILLEVCILFFFFITISIKDSQLTANSCFSLWVKGHSASWLLTATGGTYPLQLLSYTARTLRIMS